MIYRLFCALVFHCPLLLMFQNCLDHKWRCQSHVHPSHISCFCPSTDQHKQKWLAKCTQNLGWESWAESLMHHGTYKWGHGPERTSPAEVCSGESVTASRAGIATTRVSDNCHATKSTWFAQKCSQKVDESQQKVLAAGLIPSNFSHLKVWHSPVPSVVSQNWENPLQRVIPHILYFIYRFQHGAVSLLPFIGTGM